MNDIYRNIDKNNPDKKRKVLIVFDDMVADMLNNKKRNLIVTELFVRCKKLNILFVFITQSYFAVPKNIRLSTTHYFVMKFQINGCFNKLHAIIHQVLTLKTLNLYKRCTAKQYSFLALDTSFAIYIPLGFRKNLFEKI